MAVVTSTIERDIRSVYSYCESKFDNKADLSKPIDRTHLGSGLFWLNIW